ncbi:hypothetical protein [Orbus hercynius]|nr:hypothetical protein [Orbus hercynius]
MTSELSFLYQQLNHQDNAHYYRYLLLDMLGEVNELSVLYLATLKETFAKENITVVPRPELRHDLNACPHLICLATPGQMVDFEYVQNSFLEAKQEVLFNKRYICGWLISEHPPQLMAELILQAGINLGTLINQRFVPFYEPFKLQLLQEGNHICPDWIERYLAFTKRYFYLDVTVNLVDISTKRKPSGDVLMVLADQATFNLSESHNLFYLYAEYVEILADEGQYPDKYTLSQLSEYYHIASTLLTAMSDRYLLTIYCMRYGDLSKNPAVLALLNRDDKSAINDFAQALIELDERQLIIK